MSSTKTNNYRKIEKNISKFGNVYRVKVGSTQVYVHTRNEARDMKRHLLGRKK